MIRAEMIAKEVEVADYPAELRDLVEGYALEVLSKGRPGWDVPHTLAVVRWADEGRGVSCT